MIVDDMMVDDMIVSQENSENLENTEIAEKPLELPPKKSNQPPKQALTEIKDTYRSWLQIVADNKLNKHDPFKLKLIDYRVVLQKFHKKV